MVPAYNLSKREKEVAEFLLQGKSNKQIAVGLRIAESTVEFHLRNIYLKLQVRSRSEAILKLGKSSGDVEQKPRESIVEIRTERVNNRAKFFFAENLMKKRLPYYFLAGMIFGMVYWRYLNGVARILDEIGQNLDPSAVSGLAVWSFLSVIFVIIFGVWSLPTVFLAVYEFRHSAKVHQSVIAVIIVWLSAVFGYYLTYFLLLGFVGLPNMKYLLFFGRHSTTFWLDWITVFNKLILFPFLKWTAVGILVGGLAGWITSSVYSIWVRKTEAISPA